ncbi:LON peptidase substrate-binding domain-containing protein [Parasediminibacterium sp. JCM 36343]|uniref:LON peptidase substrate-binding domain-containing protein n=1 Tax=Parasediminibacterium sp. JCM 36343 TaxID=3374279 RepID=UPI00397DAA80
MTNFIPVFPLGIVVYPAEKLNLHIFEPRYKQLITDCFAEAKPFGIPTVLENGVNEMGTLVEITEVVEVYDDGKMDIKTKGLQVFKMLELIKEIPEKLYSGAIVTYPENNMRQNNVMMAEIVLLVRELHRLLNIEKDFKKQDNELLSYDIAHHIGLPVKEEYVLHGLLLEAQRLKFIKNHLKKVIPVIANTESLKKKIQLNGHFRELGGFNF